MTFKPGDIIIREYGLNPRAVYGLWVVTVIVNTSLVDALPFGETGEFTLNANYYRLATAKEIANATAHLKVGDWVIPKYYRLAEQALGRAIPLYQVVAKWPNSGKFLAKRWGTDEVEEHHFWEDEVRLAEPEEIAAKVCARLRPPDRQCVVCSGYGNILDSDNDVRCAHCGGLMMRKIKR